MRYTRSCIGEYSLHNLQRREQGDIDLGNNGAEDLIVIENLMRSLLVMLKSTQSGARGAVQSLG